MNEKLFSIRGFKNQKLISKIKSKTGLTYFPSYTLAWAPSPIFGPINSCLGSTSHLESKLKSPTEWTSLPDPILLFFFFSLEKMCNYLASSSNTHIHTLSITHVEAYQPTKEKDPSLGMNYENLLHGNREESYIPLWVWQEKKGSTFAHSKGNFPNTYIQPYPQNNGHRSLKK